MSAASTWAAPRSGAGAACTRCAPRNWQARSIATRTTNSNRSCTGIQVNAVGNRLGLEAASLPGTLLSPPGGGLCRIARCYPRRLGWHLGLAAADNRPHILLVVAERRAY